jgi:hypothetical protein
MTTQVVEFSDMKHNDTLKIPQFFSQKTPNLKILVKSDQVIGDAFVANATYKTTEMNNKVVSNNHSLVSEESIISGSDFGNLHNEVFKVTFMTAPDNKVSGSIEIIPF